ncbi:hypothetical protein N9089_03915 [Crocinitomicaceae bacterium]|nr:hypothetical protein [Crocinitomicaceae bacterium]
MKKLSLGVSFQSGLSDISTETIRRIDIIQELIGDRREIGEIAAAVVDCNNPGSIWLVVWDLNNQSIVPDSSVIRLTAIDTVIKRKRRKDHLISLLDTEALFGSGYITALMKVSRINDGLIPEGITPVDKTECVSGLEGLSVAGILEGGSPGIVTSGQFKFGKPFATLINF